MPCLLFASGGFPLLIKNLNRIRPVRLILSAAGDFNAVAFFVAFEEQYNINWNRNRSSSLSSMEHCLGVIKSPSLV